MTNREKYKNEIIEACANSHFDEFFDDRIGPEYGVEWTDLTHDATTVLTVIWLEEEYQEPEVNWSKVDVDTPIWVRDDPGDEWEPKHFAGYKNDIVYAWEDGQTSFTTDQMIVWEYAKLAEEGDGLCD